MDFDQVARTTFAAREFTSEPVADELLYRILDRARFAPSGGNRQGWRVIVVRDPAARRRLAEICKPAWRRYRAQRKRSAVPVVAIVGYTNAGKSTLLNALTSMQGADAGVYVADQLFATLDPTTRRVPLPSGRTALFTDTVGFIQKLPTTLVAAFRATLEEITEADVLLHVVDATHPNATEQAEAVTDVYA